MITAMRAPDVLYTLEKLELLQYWTRQGGFEVPYDHVVALVNALFPKRGRDRFKRAFEAECVVQRVGVNNLRD